MQNESSTTPKTPFNEWALVELFGHQKIVGLCTEATIAGGAFLRVDVPASNGKPPFTRFYGASAIYSINPIGEGLAKQLIESYRAEPVSRFDLPALEAKCADQPDYDAGDDES